MITTNDDVKLNGIKPEINFALIIIYSIYQGYFDHMRVNSVTEGRHSRTSLHYPGFAIDISTDRFLTEVYAEDFARVVRTSLTNEFDVVLEWGDGSHPHLHVEFQPKRPD